MLTDQKIDFETTDDQAVKQKPPKGGWPSGFSEWLIGDRPHRYRFCVNVPATGPEDSVVELYAGAYGIETRSDIVIAKYRPHVTGMFARISNT